MSASASETEEKGSAYLEQLKQAAEAQMRRPAPPLPAPKKHKQNKASGPNAAAADTGTLSDGEEGGGEAAAAERVGRYSYAAADAVVAGCAGFIGMCDFKRSSSATKEMLEILKAVLPGEHSALLATAFACVLAASFCKYPEVAEPCKHHHRKPIMKGLSCRQLLPPEAAEPDYERPFIIGFR
jgi:hypothetical protein